MSNEDKIKKILEEIEHPEIAYTLSQLGMIDNVQIEENKVSLVLKVPMLGIPIRDYLIESIKEAIRKEDEKLEVRIEVEEMSEEERARFMRMAQEAWRG